MRVPLLGLGDVCPARGTLYLRSVLAGATSERLLDVADQLRTMGQAMTADSPADRVAAQVTQILADARPHVRGGGVALLEAAKALRRAGRGGMLGDPVADALASFRRYEACRAHVGAVAQRAAWQIRCALPGLAPD